MGEVINNHLHSLSLHCLSMLLWLVSWRARDDLAQQRVAKRLSNVQLCKGDPSRFCRIRLVTADDRKFILPFPKKIRGAHPFNDIMSSGVYPSRWKISYVTPIYKSGDRLNVVGYALHTACIAMYFFFSVPRVVIHVWFHVHCSFIIFRFLLIQSSLILACVLPQVMVPSAI